MRTNVIPKSRRRRFVLNSRDIQILIVVFLLHCASRDQLRLLFFGSLQRTNSRLLQLTKAGYLVSYIQPTKRYGLQSLYFLGPKALSAVQSYVEEQELDIDADTLRRQFFRPALSLTEHTLAIGDVYCALRQYLLEQADISLPIWLPEQVARVEYDLEAGGSNRPARKEVFAPDAYFELHRTSDRWRQAYALEVDCGHAATAVITRKLATTRRLVDSGLFQRLFGQNDVVTLVVTTSRRRLANLREHTEEFQGVVAYTTFDQVSQGIDYPIWLFGQGDPARRLVRGEG